MAAGVGRNSRRDTLGSRERRESGPETYGALSPPLTPLRLYTPIDHKERVKGWLACARGLEPRATELHAPES